MATPDCSTRHPAPTRAPIRAQLHGDRARSLHTSFNYAQTNFAAIWMRAKWFLFTDGAVTDSQYGGLNFTTGGGYTHSDSPVGNWMLAYRSVFIGSSQARPSTGNRLNAYASDAGPFNPDHRPRMQQQCGLRLLSLDGRWHQHADRSISRPAPIQRLRWTGVSASRMLTSTFIRQQFVGQWVWMYINRHEDGVPKDSAGSCYLPNAAIAWKQPNGFYYPPAFHSQNLMFQNANIRHFLIEPLFNGRHVYRRPNQDPGSLLPGQRLAEHVQQFH